MRTRDAIDLPNGGTVQLGADPVFRDVAVRADPGIELGAVRTGGQALGPMMIDGTSWEWGQEIPGCGNASLTFSIKIVRHAIGVGDIEVGSHQNHAEW